MYSSISRTIPSNRLQDTFEDAQDITPKPRARSPEATRSLTERRPSLKSPASKERKKSDASRTSKSGRDSQTSMAEKLPKDEKLEPARERKQSQSIINPKSLGTLDEVNLAESESILRHAGTPLTDKICRQKFRFTLPPAPKS